ncbi:hypothetical protein LEMLEM_LOCUS24741, partial [Lemmus lemmus]
TTNSLSAQATFLAPEGGEGQDHRPRSSALDFWLAFVSSLRSELEKKEQRANQVTCLSLVTLCSTGWPGTLR